MKADLETIILEWGGKQTQPLEEGISRFGNDPNFASTLLELLPFPAYHVGGTWLLKRFLEMGGRLNSNQISKLIKIAPDFDDWQSMLHFMQILPKIDLSSDDAKKVEPLIRNGMNSSNKFLRAWSYTGLYKIAIQTPSLGLEDEAIRLFYEIMDDKNEAASVKARIRKLIKTGFHG